MELNQLSNSFAFDNVSGVIGEIAGIDFLKQSITISSDSGTITAKLENVTLLEKIGFIGKQEIINHDVVTTADGKLYEIELVDKDTVQLFLLNNKLGHVEAGDMIAKTDLAVLQPYVTFVGNVNVLELTSTIDFNIRVVREILDGDVTYYYACNNKGEEEIDLIKVVFIGIQLLEEEDYERYTLSYEDYLEEVDAGDLKEVNPQELMNYVTGLTYGKEPSQKPSQKPSQEKEEVLEDYCEECGASIDECDCECECEW